MNIFEILNSLLYSKKRLEINLEDENTFSGFMINRWVSMYNRDLTCFINDLFNRVSPLESKQDQYNLYYNLLPKLRFKKISYIKKNKPDQSKEEKLPRKEFLSEREMAMYVDLLK